MQFKALRLPAAALLAAGIISSCSSLRLEPADFGWPVESELTVDGSNRVDETRYGVRFNVAALAAEEFQDTAALKGSTLRVLRAPGGAFFVTGPGFEHVYVFGAGDGSLDLRSKIRVTPAQESGRNGLRHPALNQRPPYVELLDEGGLRVLLTPDGAAEAPSAKGETTE
jgi:hypothetical protein